MEKPRVVALLEIFDGVDCSGRIVTVISRVRLVVIAKRTLRKMAATGGRERQCRQQELVEVKPVEIRLKHRHGTIEVRLGRADGAVTLSIDNT